MATSSPCWANVSGGRIVLQQVQSIGKATSTYKPLYFGQGPYPTVKLHFVFFQRHGPNSCLYLALERIVFPPKATLPKNSIRM